MRTVIRSEPIRSMTHHLYFGPTYIGRVDEVFEHQGTYFGEFQLETNREMDHEMDRLILFIDFCRDWFNAQTKPSPPDASCFVKFADLIGHGRWTIIDESMHRHTIADAPMFKYGRSGELSWMLALQSESG